MPNVANVAMAIPFNPLQFANRLKQAGVPPAQAEAQAEAMNDAFAQQTQVVSNLENQVQAMSADRQRDAAQAASKGDIAELRGEIAELRNELHSEIAGLRGEMVELRNELHSEIAGLRNELHSEIAGLRNELHSELALIRKEAAIGRRDTIIWLGSMLFLGFGSVMMLLLRLLPQS